MLTLCVCVCVCVCVCEQDLDDEDKLMAEWFDMVQDKTRLVRHESELVYELRDLELMEQHDQLEAEIRRRLLKDGEWQDYVPHTVNKGLINLNASSNVFEHPPAHFTLQKWFHSHCEWLFLLVVEWDLGVPAHITSHTHITSLTHITSHTHASPVTCTHHQPHISTYHTCEPHFILFVRWVEDRDGESGRGCHGE